MNYSECGYDSPEVFRLASDCPKCGAPLQLRENSRTAELFVGCNAYPHCRFTEPYEPLLQRFAKAVERLAAQGPGPCEHTMALDTMLKRLITVAHPDKWHGNPVAHEITIELIKVREALRRGSHV